VKSSYSELCSNRLMGDRVATAHLSVMRSMAVSRISPVSEPLWRPARRFDQAGVSHKERIEIGDPAETILRRRCSRRCVAPVAPASDRALGGYGGEPSGPAGGRTGRCRKVIWEDQRLWCRSKSHRGMRPRCLTGCRHVPWSKKCRVRETQPAHRSPHHLPTSATKLFPWSHAATRNTLLTIYARRRTRRSD